MEDLLQLNDPFERDAGGRTSSRAITSVMQAWLTLAAGAIILAFAGLGLSARADTNGDAAFPAIQLGALGVATVAILAAFAVTLSSDAADARDVMRRGVIFTAVCTAIVSAGAASTMFIAVYDGGTSRGGVLASSTGGHSHGAGNAHDHGVHPTFTQFQTLPVDELVSMSPANTLAASDILPLRTELNTLYTFTRRVTTIDAALAAGYDPSSVDVDSMGAHYLNVDYLTDGVFDPARPEGLLFSAVEGGEPELVGVWFLQIPGSDGATETIPPAGFTGALDAWHGHEGICFVGLEAVAEGVTEQACAARNGLYLGDQRWMMHVWIAPEVTENPDGVFAYLNRDLAARQVASVPLGQGEIR
jgi:hypothetical protein